MDGERGSDVFYLELFIIAEMQSSAGTHHTIEHHKMEDKKNVLLKSETSNEIISLSLSLSLSL